MNWQDFQKQWTDYLDDRLTVADDRSLSETLATEQALALRERALRDAELHGLLLALGRIESSRDTFVDGVVRQLTTEEKGVAPMPRSEPPACETTNAEPGAPSRRRDVSPPPHPQGATCATPLPAPEFERDSEPPVVTATDRFERISKGPRERNAVQPVWNRHRWTTMLCAVTLVWLIGLGLVFVVTTYDHPHADRSLSSHPNAEARRNQSAPGILPTAEAPEASGAAGIPPDPAPVEMPRPSQPSPKPIHVRPPATPSTVADRAPNPPVQIEPPAATVLFGRIVDDAEAKWESQVVPQGGPIRLRAGKAKIEMTGGARLVVQGPAEFEFLSPNRLSLALGELAATVPEAAVGFSVKTPSSQVVDLGTEFIVDVDDASATAVHVLRGEVEVSVAKTGEEDRRWRLTTGRYKWVSGDGAQDLDWRMHLTIEEKQFEGVLNTNGREFDFAEAEEFIPLYAKMMHELSQLRRLLLSTRPRRAAEPFQAEININGQRSTISDSIEYARTYPLVKKQLQQLLTRASQQGASRRGGAFSGSFNIDGQEFQLNGIDDLLKLREEIKQGTGHELRPVPKLR